MKNNKWSVEDIHRLIHHYKKQKCLWNKNTSCYVNSKKRYKAYKKIHEDLGKPGVTLIQLIMMIKNIRKSYVSQLEELIHNKKTNERQNNKASSWFYELHKFLKMYLNYDELNCLYNDHHKTSNPTKRSLSNKYKRQNEYGNPINCLCSRTCFDVSTPKNTPLINSTSSKINLKCRKKYHQVTGTKVCKLNNHIYYLSLLFSLI